MPGWYVHMEAAARTAERMRAQQLPVGVGVDPGEFAALGDLCHKWRNYLEIGALGPDLFFMLPDFSQERGTVIRHVVKWALEVWQELDANFISKWNKWVGPISDNMSGIIAQIDGGVLNMLGQALDNLAAAVVTALKGLLAEMGDWFGILTSGVPQGFGDSAFYWSDMFHYRGTYRVPYLLYANAIDAFEASAPGSAEREDAEAQLAFSVGWMSHCATDVAGHPFTNAKCGGPYRDHWQRHHLIENHMDGQNYGADHTGDWYGDYGVSALHFRVALKMNRVGYPGRSDAPAYDFTQGFPAYPTGHSAAETAERDEHFNLPTEPFPRHLSEAIRVAMSGAYGDRGPKILAQDPAFSALGSDGLPDGRPNDAAFDEMWSIVYAYLKMSGSDGLSPYAPSPPPLINDHSFPQPPGGDYGVSDDPTRGADLDDSDFNILDLLLAIFAWAVYLAQVALWIATVLPGLIADIATFPLRLVLYYAFVVPAWDLYLMTRRTLVMSGFLVPNRDEVDLGLTTMGHKAGQADSFVADLDSASGFAPPPALQITEPSGRPSPSAEFGLDGGYPRNIVRDSSASLDAVDLPGIFGLTGPLHYRDDVVEFVPSEWLKPWNYPLRTPGGRPVRREERPAHVGPFVIGDTSTALLSNLPGHPDALAAFESAATDADTAEACHDHLHLDQHMGGPIDYGVYIAARFHEAKRLGAAKSPLPDFNLDADRGYAWLTWDWVRHPPAPPWMRSPNWPNRDVFAFARPCTPPQFIGAKDNDPDLPRGADPDKGEWYDENGLLETRYLGAVPRRFFPARRMLTCGHPAKMPVDIKWPGAREWSRQEWPHG